MTKTKVVICPYCGETQSATERCRGCGGLFEPLSRQATHNAMGPWFIRDPGKPFQPGCSYETIVRMIDRGQVSKYSIVRGPTSRQFWTVAKHLPGVAHLLGYCHNCDASVDPGDNGCHVCGVSFGAYLDRNYLGLPDVRPLPWEAGIENSSSRQSGDVAAGPPGRAPGAVGISGFASDDELIDPGPARAMAAAGRSAHERSGESSGSAPGFDGRPSPATMRALRRKLDGRQRMVNVLAVLLSVVIILFVITTVSTTARSSPGLVPVQGSLPAVSHDPVVETPVPESPVPGPEANEPAADPVTVVSTRAQQLIDSAGRKDRLLDERIGDLERALQDLKELDATASSQMISQVEWDLERLRLERDFFGTAEPE